MNFLDKIVAAKKEQLSSQKKIFTEAGFRGMEYFSRKCIPASQRLLKAHSSGIIAEFKRKSPSKGFIHKNADAAAITASYTENGAAALSVLTDEIFFGGSNADLLAARKNNIPILRKDFIIDTYQVAEAKAIGADIILLIAACLSTAGVKELAAYARELGMEVLLELHEEEELDHICDEINWVGINNRNLKTFEVNVQRSLALSGNIAPDKIKIAESGIDNPATVAIFREAGFRGFLIGEHFMKEPHPGESLHYFIQKINNNI